MIHIAFEHLYFKSRREEWSVRVWRDIKYKAPRKAPKVEAVTLPPLTFEEAIAVLGKKPDDPITIAKSYPDGEAIKQGEEKKP